MGITLPGAPGSRMLLALLGVSIGLAVGAAAAGALATATASVSRSDGSATPTGVLVQFVDAGPGPRQVTITLDTDGSAKESVSGMPETPASRRFQVGLATVSALAAELHRAHLPTLKGTYGLPNPGGAWTTITAGGRAVTVYPCASSVCTYVPDDLRTLIRSLERIASAHEPPSHP